MKNITNKTVVSNANLCAKCPFSFSCRNCGQETSEMEISEWLNMTTEDYLCQEAENRLDPDAVIWDEEYGKWDSIHGGWSNDPRPSWERAEE